MSFEYDYPRPAVAADVLVFTQNPQNEMSLLLIRRRHMPFAGQWALPGGFLNEDETLEQAAVRELREETGLQVSEQDLVQLRAYSNLDRDPRTRVISVVFAATVDSKEIVMASDDACDANWFPVSELPELAFDHQQIVQDGLKFLESEVNRS